MKHIQLDELTTKEKGYLFGLFFGDGYKYFDRKSRHYVVEFYLNSIKDNKIIKFVCFLLRKISLNPFLMKDKRFNCIRIKINSREFFEFIDKKINLNKKNKDFNIGFLSGLIDSEGYCNNEKSCIEVVSTNEKILRDCKKFLDLIGIGSSLNKRKPSNKDKKESYRILISVKFKRLNHLSIKAGKAILI